MRKIVSYGIDFSIPSYSQEMVWTTGIYLPNWDKNECSWV